MKRLCENRACGRIAEDAQNHEYKRAERQLDAGGDGCDSEGGGGGGSAC
jgi:hypothetical protein